MTPEAYPQTSSYLLNSQQLTVLQTRNLLRPLLWTVSAALLVLGGAGCGQAEAPPEYVARVGEQYLTRADVDALLSPLPAGQDTTEVRERLVQQWVTQALLYREAARRGLGDDPDVQRRLRENERSVLVSALLDELYREEAAPVSPAAMQTYFQQHREQLRLREPFVRVRHLATASEAEATSARRQMRDAPPASADSLWQALARDVARDPQAAVALSSTYHPEARLFTTQPALAQALGGLRPGDVAPVLAADGLFHVLQLVDRVPAGTVPELGWVEAELRERLAIEARKQMVERQVQRLRNEAMAREDLEIR